MTVGFLPFKVFGNLAANHLALSGVSNNCNCSEKAMEISCTPWVKYFFFF